MDASSLTPDVCDEESVKRQKVTYDRDIISNLPECILSHILSFLPTKFAVQTSVLSTRWKYTWTCVTNLHFDDRLFYSTKGRVRRGHFINSVDKVLRRYRNSNIQSFHISCCRGYRASRVNASISAAIRRKVQRLEIHHYDESFVYPISLFTSDSLIELSLRMFGTLEVPTTICFSTLKFLDLFKVKFLIECSSQTKQLLLNFPVLKVLNLSSCTWLDMETVDISAPVLDSFTLRNSKWTLDGSHDCVIKICAPCLTKFKCEGCLSEDIILPSSLLIVDAAVEILTEKATVDQMFEMGLRACELFKDFSNVKYLTLSTEIFQVLACLEDLATHMFVFDKLTHLKLSSLMGLRRLSKTVMALFQSSPNLECLVFVGGISCWDYDDDLALEMVPQCFLSNLKVVKYHNFGGTEPELSIVKFLLKNLKVLEEMTITLSLKLNSQKPKPKVVEVKKKRKRPSYPTEIPEIEKEEVKKQLLSFPKASSRASIVFP